MKPTEWYLKRLLLPLAVYFALIGSVYQISKMAATLTRGPYLQIGTPNSIVVRWRTNPATDSRVQYGANPSNLDMFVDDPTVTIEHEVTLGGLNPNRQYYYSVGSTSGPIVSGPDYYFVTAPPAGTPEKSRIWILGDAGTANANQMAVRDSYYNFTGATPTNLWVMLGDNAYGSGKDTEYQNAVFNMYPATLRQSVLWPAFGNHDAGSASSPAQSGVFYNIFTLPKNAEAGGVATGTEAYYSFDYANIHFICLNSHDIPRQSTGAMMTWLQNDLAATTQDWIIAFWHHPPYTFGSHNSDSESQLIDMRQNALPILESAGVDLVFTGHSHSYERSFLLDGHYGLSSTLTSSNILNSGSGRVNGDGAYTKPNLGQSSHQGAVYVVAGSSGKTSGGSLNHPAMYISLNLLGSVVLDIDGNRAEVNFIGATSNILDYFTMIKGGATLNSPNNLTATAVSGSQIDLTWTDRSNNEDGFKIERKIGAGGTYAEIATAGANVTGYSDAGLATGTTYYYQVRAYNGAGNSGYSNEANATTPGNSNLALNKPATASNTNGSNTPGKAVDGSISTYWRSGSLNSNTIVSWRVDLGAVLNFQRVVIKWNSSYYARRYQIRVSNDDASWTTIYTDNSGNGGTDDFTVPATSARYVQVYMTRNNKSSERINETEIYASVNALISTANEDVPKEIVLTPNYPNPFNPRTSIDFVLPEEALVTLKVYNIIGAEVATLVNERRHAGIHTVEFEAANLSSGVYFSVLQVGEARQVRRLVLMK